MKPTYEELEAELVETRKLLKKALDRIAKLEEQLKLNSKNSSKPPSSNQKISKKGRKKNGAKPGHPEHFRPLFAKEEVGETRPKGRGIVWKGPFTPPKADLNYPALKVSVQLGGDKIKVYL